MYAASRLGVNVDRLNTVQAVITDKNGCIRIYDKPQRAGRSAALIQSAARRRGHADPTGASCEQTRVKP